MCAAYSKLPLRVFNFAVKNSSSDYERFAESEFASQIFSDVKIP